MNLEMMMILERRKSHLPRLWVPVHVALEENEKAKGRARKEHSLNSYSSNLSVAKEIFSNQERCTVEIKILQFFRKMGGPNRA